MNRTPEIEPLSEARWARIEQSVLQRLAGVPLGPPESAPVKKLAGARVLVGTFAAALAIAAAVALFIVSPSTRTATSRVATEASPSHVTIAEASIDLSPESGIVVREEEHATVVVLERGEIALHVSPRPKDRPLLVEAGEVHVRVVGTEFSVRRVDVGAVVKVQHGIVEVTARGEVARVKAGEAWPEEAVAPVAVAAPLPVAPLSAPESIAAPPVVAGVRTDATSVRAGVAPGRAPAARPTHRTAGASGAVRAASTPAPAPSAPETLSAPPAIVVAPPAPAEPPQDSPPPSVATESSSQAQYEAAERIERKDPDGALRGYTALAQGYDAWAQDALFAAGRLQADRGARADAIRLLEEYLRRFPRGSNAQDARTLRETLR